MKERPILFSGAMVRALSDGSKTQTRRVIKDQSIGERFSHMTDTGLAHLEWLGEPSCGSGVWDVPEYSADVASPYGQPGDRLWVRESWQFYDWTEDGLPCVRFAADNAIKWTLRIPEEQADRLTEIWAGLSAPENYSIDNHARDRRWRPSIHMPRWASRITLEITSVRVERLQDISEGDAVAEGIEQMPCAVPDTRLWRNYDPGNGWTPSLAIPQNSFRSLWESINGPDSWDENPWVWVVAFSPPTTA